MGVKTFVVHSSELTPTRHFWADSPLLMIMPSTDIEMAHRASQLAASRAGEGAEGCILCVRDVRFEGFVAIVNRVFAMSSSPWVGYMAQDAFAGRSWLALAQRKLEQSGATLLGFNDGKWQGQLASFGLASRSWIEQQYRSGFFFEGYRSHYADAELTVLARAQGRYAYEPNSVLMEVDWNKDRSSVNPDDRKLFKARAQQGFDARVSNPDLLQLFG